MIQKDLEKDIEEKDLQFFPRGGTFFKRYVKYGTSSGCHIWYSDIHMGCDTHRTVS